MKHYRINVAKPNGELTYDGYMKYVHLFRTDWIDNENDARYVFSLLTTQFSDCTVSLSSRDMRSTLEDEYKP